MIHDVLMCNAPCGLADPDRADWYNIRYQARNINKHFVGANFPAS
jgi:hypothetical protein